MWYLKNCGKTVVHMHHYLKQANRAKQDIWSKLYPGQVLDIINMTKLYGSGYLPFLELEKPGNQAKTIQNPHLLRD